MYSTCNLCGVHIPNINSRVICMNMFKAQCAVLWVIWTLGQTTLTWGEHIRRYSPFYYYPQTTWIQLKHENCIRFKRQRNILHVWNITSDAVIRVIFIRQLISRSCVTSHPIDLHYHFCEYMCISVVLAISFLFTAEVVCILFLSKHVVNK